MRDYRSNISPHKYVAALTLNNIIISIMMIIYNEMREKITFYYIIKSDKIWRVRKHIIVVVKTVKIRSRYKTYSVVQEESCIFCCSFD